MLQSQAWAGMACCFASRRSQWVATQLAEFQSRFRPTWDAFSSEINIHFSDKCLQHVRNKHINIGRQSRSVPMSELKNRISALVKAAEPGHVWVPSDFAELGKRDAVDKTLQRMVQKGELRRIDRGLYDRPKLNGLTQRPTAPDYRAVVDAIARRDQLRLLVDGMTAANDLGLTDAVPARVTLHTDMRRRAVQLDQLTIEFKQTAPSRLYWAGRPAMRVVQALHWLKDTWPSDRSRILDQLSRVLADPVHGAAIRQDLLDGFKLLPAWMQSIVRELLAAGPQTAPARPSAPAGKEAPVLHHLEKHAEVP